MSDSPGRRVRALPPRPSISTVATKASSQPQEVAAQQEGLPNPHLPSGQLPSANGIERPSPGSSDGRHSVYTSDLSTSAHAAVMDHASYMQTVFIGSTTPPPKYSERLLR